MNSHILIIGTGALGSAVAEMLARSGVGHLTLCDMDIVSESNLHRQSLFDESDCAENRLKVEALKNHIGRINSTVQIDTYDKEITSQNIENVMQFLIPNLIIDGTDNFHTRYLLNDVCHKYKIPWIYGACLGVRGTVLGIDPKDSENACLRCIMPEVPDTGEDCALIGIMPQTAHLSASMQVAEVMHYMKTGTFSGKLMTFDCFEMKFQQKPASLFLKSDCLTCQKGIYTTLNRAPAVITKMCHGKYTVRLHKDIFNIPVQGTVKYTTHFKLIKDENHHAHIMRDGRMILFDTYSKDEVRNTVREWFGISI